MSFVQTTKDTHGADGEVDTLEVSRTVDVEARIEDTTLLGEGTIRDGSGTVTIDEPEESRYLIVWFTRLGTSGPESYAASISEILLTR